MCVWEGGLASLALLVVGVGEQRRRIYRGALSTARIPNPHSHSHQHQHQHQHLQFISSSIQSRKSLVLISFYSRFDPVSQATTFSSTPSHFLAFAQSSILNPPSDNLTPPTHTQSSCLPSPHPNLPAWLSSAAAATTHQSTQGEEDTTHP